MNYFEKENVQAGNLVTVTYNDGTKISGIVTDVSLDSITFIFYNEFNTPEKTTVNTISVSQIEKGLVKLDFAAHVSSSKKTAKKRGLESIRDIKNIESLFKALRSERPEVIALIATYLTNDQRAKLLYTLPKELLSEVQSNLTKMKLVSPEKFKEVEGRLAKKVDELLQRQEQFQNRRQEQPKTETNPFDMFGGGLGGFDPLEMLKNFQGKNSTSNLDSSITDMLGKLSKGLSDIFGDDDDNRRF